jgi:uncharacterized protein YecT (DUF1311 family)
MKSFFLKFLLTVLLSTTALTAFAECGVDTSDAAVKDCLAQDLRDSDKRINAVYKLLMGSMNDADKTSLRDAQRAWLKNRDKACSLDNKESNREKWLQAILTNQKKTVCVVRYTFERVSELDALLKQKAPAKTVEAPVAPQAPQFPTDAAGAAPTVPLPASFVFAEDGYKAITANSHERGKWYYEVWIDRAAIAHMGDLLITPGYFSQKGYGVIRMVNVRHTQTGMPPIVIGLALDLDDGFVYVRQDEQWQVAPGVAGAVTVPMNAPFVGGIESSTNIRELISRGLVKVNVGERPFGTTPPEGYRAWGEN